MTATRLGWKSIAIVARNGKSPPSPPPSDDGPFMWPLISFSKPPWIVRTQSNVRLEKRRKPEPPCTLCKGGGRVDCHSCRGKGRTNEVKLEVLPDGVWPKWCRNCGGSGLDYCPRCEGSGEYRYPMGFHIPRRDSDATQDNFRDHKH